MNILLDLIKQNKKIDSKEGELGYIQKIRHQIQQQPISDIVDQQGNQYIDLVLEGGTVWGIALIGYTYTLEKAGIRFLNLAGTSAGAINATILAALGTSSEPKSEKLIEIFSEMDFNSFIDGGKTAQNLLNDIKEKDNVWTAIFPKLLWLGIRGKFRGSKLGINPGDVFEEWLEKTLEKYHIKNTADLFQKFKNENLSIRKDVQRTGADKTRFNNNFKVNHLAIVAADITTESKIIFPEMGYLYWDEPLKTHPKKYVRASMSIPLIFEPVRIEKLPQNRQEYWRTLTGYQGPVPEIAYLVDGGVISNFPIDVFHANDVIPLCPTFGVKLGIDRKQALKIKDILDFGGALLYTVTNNSDYSFLFHNEDYSKLIAYIDTSIPYKAKELDKKGTFWQKILAKFKQPESEIFSSLDFNMSNPKKAALFALGTEAAYEFICGNDSYHKTLDKEKLPPDAICPFDWEEYKKLREKLIVTDTDLYKKKKEQRRLKSLFP
ncbi:patatin-like phospholipase family protein [uncultured Acinetobacter sp.]|uniref:patatin-like phospholipase family protein n=1 Tax=uncultured Acinetobacter sp. TaxID=165433 RepID=UPI0026246CA9|nr:patatin-like phospholipase family protein [uncultured Acinetobacter sp.]